MTADLMGCNDPMLFVDPSVSNGPGAPCSVATGGSMFCGDPMGSGDPRSCV